jgi:ribosomal protein L20
MRRPCTHFAAEPPVLLAPVPRDVLQREKHKEVLKMAKGFRGRAKNCWTVASNKVEKSLQHAYVGRKLKKRDFRTLWIQQVRVDGFILVPCRMIV